VIDTEAQLAELLPHLRKAERVAVDTEADSLHAYPEKLCLIQLSVGEEHALVDPLSTCDLAPALALLQTKELILHGADYDLRLFHRSYQFVPQTIFDTMWAARLLGYREFGLSNLVQALLGVTLEKGPQKGNWALRPLPPRMAAYALNDTRYLRPLAEDLRARLAQAGRLHWMQEVCGRVIRDCSQTRARDPEAAWRVKGSDRLDPPALAILRVLWQWREEEAINANKPPYFILSHETLVALSMAVSQPRAQPNIIPHRLHPRRADRLAAAIQKAIKTPPSEYPHPRRSFGVRLTKSQQLHFDQLKRVRDQRAEDLGLDPTVIASKSDHVALAKDGEGAQTDLMAWQRPLLDLEGAPCGTATP